MIPPLDPVTGQLPHGRFSCTLPEVKAAFVDDPAFASSGTRQLRFEKMVEYLFEWQRVESAAGVGKILRDLWIGGSFTSAVLNPEDVDVSPIVDAEALDRLRGKPGSKNAKELFSQRTAVRMEYGVEPFVVLWRPVTVLKVRKLDMHGHDYVATRGLMDDFWQRCAPPGPKGPMTTASAGPARGYLEVKL